MPVIKFEDRTLRGLKVPEGRDREEWSDTVCPGLRFRKSAGGHTSFSVVYRIKGRSKQERRTIGPWPRISLAQARKEANEDLLAAGAGKDPQLLRRAPDEEPTVAELFEMYRASRSQDLASWRQKAGAFRKHILPLVGFLPASAVRKHHLHEMIEPLLREGQIPGARHVLSHISGLYTWAQGRELVENNPANGFPQPARIEEPKRKALSASELRDLWCYLARAVAEPDVPARGGMSSRRLLALVVMSRFLLGQRSKEVLWMRRQDLEEQWWNMPARIGRRRYTKNGRPHRVPLIPLWQEVVRPVLEELTPGEEYCFASIRRARANQGKPLTTTALFKFCDRARRESGVEFSPRNARTTFITGLVRLKIPKETRIRLINHAGDGSVESRHYNLYDYDEEKWAAGLVWDNYLRRTLFGAELAPVVPFSRA